MSNGHTWVFKYIELLIENQRRIGPMETLEEMRKSIDNIDNAIIVMLAERFKVTDRVGAYKAENKLPPKDKAREAKQYNRLNDLAIEYGLEPEFANSFLSLIIDCVIERHQALTDSSC